MNFELRPKVHSGLYYPDKYFSIIQNLNMDGTVVLPTALLFIGERPYYFI